MSSLIQIVADPLMHTPTDFLLTTETLSGSNNINNSHDYYCSNNVLLEEDNEEEEGEERDGLRSERQRDAGCPLPRLHADTVLVWSLPDAVLSTTATTCIPDSYGEKNLNGGTGSGPAAAAGSTDRSRDSQTNIGEKSIQWGTMSMGQGMWI